METIDSMRAVQARIQAIRSQFVVTAPAPAAPTSTTAAAGSSAFAQILADAAGVATPNATTGSGGPMGYDGLSNGRIPDHLLVDIGDGHELHPAAAVQWEAMKAAMAAEGIEVPITSSYRSYEEQADLVERKGRYSEGGLAADPGHSNHGWGLSLDLDLDPRATAWMQAHAAEYGWENDVPREPWHWTFTGALAGAHR